jgi:hypothetical protein
MPTLREIFPLSSGLIDKFMKFCVIMLSTRHHGYKKRELSEVNLERAVTRPVLNLDGTRLRHNPGLRISSLDRWYEIIFQLRRSRPLHNLG